MSQPSKPIYDHTIREVSNGMLQAITGTLQDINNKNTNKILIRDHRLFYFGLIIIFITILLLIIF